MADEVHYFADPQLDRAVGMIWQLVAELHITDQRCRALEALLVRNGVLAPDELDSFEPAPEESAALADARDAMMRRILRVLTEDGPREHPLRSEGTPAANPTAARA